MCRMLGGVAGGAVGDALAKLEFAARRAHDRDQRGARPGRDREIDREGSEPCADGRRLRVLGAQIGERRTFPRGRRRVRARAPVDQKRHHAARDDAARIGESPLEERSIGTPAAAVEHRAELDTARGCRPHEIVEGGAVRSPGRQARTIERVDAEWSHHAGCRWVEIGRDDLEVAPGTETEEAVRLTEEAFIAEFGRLVGRLVERLGEPAPGEPKRVFRDSAVENLSEFFSRFRELSVHNSEDLDRLVEQAKSVVRDVAPQGLRNSGALRERIARDLGAVQQSLDSLMIERPRRRILRPSATMAVA